MLSTTLFKSTTRPSRSRCSGPRSRLRIGQVAAAVVMANADGAAAVPWVATAGIATFCITVVAAPVARSVTVPVSVPIAITVPLLFTNLVRFKVPVNALGELGALVTGNCVATSVGCLAAADSGVSIVAKARIVAAAILFMIIISPYENIIQIELRARSRRAIEGS